MWLVQYGFTSCTPWGVIQARTSRPRTRKGWGRAGHLQTASAAPFLHSLKKKMHINTDQCVAALFYTLQFQLQLYFIYLALQKPWAWPPANHSCNLKEKLPLNRMKPWAGPDPWWGWRVPPGHTAPLKPSDVSGSAVALNYFLKTWPIIELGELLLCQTTVRHLHRIVLIRSL